MQRLSIAAITLLLAGCITPAAQIGMPATSYSNHPAPDIVNWMTSQNERLTKEVADLRENYQRASSEADALRVRYNRTESENRVVTVSNTEALRRVDDTVERLDRVTAQMERMKGEILALCETIRESEQLQEQAMRQIEGRVGRLANRRGDGKRASGYSAADDAVFMRPVGPGTARK